MKYVAKLATVFVVLVVFYYFGYFFEKIKVHGNSCCCCCFFFFAFVEFVFVVVVEFCVLSRYLLIGETLTKKKCWPQQQRVLIIKEKHQK